MSALKIQASPSTAMWVPGLCGPYAPIRISLRESPQTSPIPADEVPKSPEGYGVGSRKVANAIEFGLPPCLNWPFST